MMPQLYRRIPYQRTIHQNNFYNGTLELSFLNKIKDKISVEDIYREQKKNIIIYHQTLQNKKTIDLLNQDIFYSRGQEAFEAQELTKITNSIQDRMQELIKNYYPSKAMPANMSVEEKKTLISNLNKGLSLYTNILNEIGSKPFNIDKRIMTNLSRLQKDLREYETAIKTFDKTGEYFSSNLQGAFWKLQSLLRSTNGYVLETESTNTLSNWMPDRIQIENIGNIYIDGKESPIDIIAFNKLDMWLPMSYWIADVNNSSKKIQKTGSLKEFFEDVKANRTKSFYIDSNIYEEMCAKSLATVQAKASSSNAKKIRMKTSQQLFESHGRTSVIAKNKKTINLSNLYTQYNSIYFKALNGLRQLYELSEFENTNKGSNYYDATAQYQALINMHLGSMLPLILNNNQFLLSNRYGLITFADLFRQNKVYFTWGTRKTANLSTLESEKRDIILQMG